MILKFALAEAVANRIKSIHIALDASRLVHFGKRRTFRAIFRVDVPEHVFPEKFDTERSLAEIIDEIEPFNLEAVHLKAYPVF